MIQRLTITTAVAIVGSMLFVLSAVSGLAQPLPALRFDEEGVQFLVVGDWGRNGEDNQTDVARMMGRVARQMDIDVVVSTGDNFYPSGVASTRDPLWMSSFENIYTSHALHVPWLVALGNHDYHGSIQAQVDYSQVSRRWHMPSRYFTYTVEDDDVTVRFVVIDTNPFQTDYQADTTDGYTDLRRQDTTRQLRWLDSVLASATERWTIVVGHHPMYTGGKRKGGTGDMLRVFKPMLERHKVPAYFAGHEHDLQIHDDRTGTLFMVSGAGSEVRPTGPLPNSLFAVSKPGFMAVSASADRLTINVVDAMGTVLHTSTR